MNTYRIEISNNQRMLISAALYFYANRDTNRCVNTEAIEKLADKFSQPENSKFDGFNHLFYEPKE